MNIDHTYCKNVTEEEVTPVKKPKMSHVEVQTSKEFLTCLPHITKYRAKIASLRRKLQREIKKNEDLKKKVKEKETITTERFCRFVDENFETQVAVFIKMNMKKDSTDVP